MADSVRSVALDYSKLKLDHPDYASKTPAEARQKIKKILDLANFAIATEPINLSAASRIIGSDFLPSRMSTRAVVNGVTWVIANVDGTENTGKVVYGKPVVFDTTTGKTVTGINEKWSADEYKIIGVALDELASGRKMIPVAVGQNPQSATTSTVLAKCKVSDGGTHPSIQDWSEADHTDQMLVWEFELPKASEFKETDKTLWFKDIGTAGETRWQGSGEYVKAYNLDRTYVYKNAVVLLTKYSKAAQAQYYFNFEMSPTIYGTLDADLTKNDSALITIDTALLGGIEGTKVKVHDRFLSTGKKLASGVKVGAVLERMCEQGNVDGEFSWRFHVMQSNACPVPE